MTGIANSDIEIEDDYENSIHDVSTLCKFTKASRINLLMGIVKY